MFALFLACTTEPTAIVAVEDPGPIEVRLALNWFPEPEFGGFYEGTLGGHYEAAGFKVEVIPGGPGAPTLEQLATGKVEAALTASDDLLLKRSRGLKVVGAWPAFQLAPNGLMTHASGPASFDDITAGQVAIELGSPLQTFLWGRYAWEGKVAAVPYSGAIGPFVSDPTFIQQAYITSEPCLAKAQGVEVNFLRAADAGWNPYGSLVAFADPPPAWADDFIAATETAWAAYMADPSRGNAEISRLNDQMKPELMGCITEKQAPFVTGEDGMGVMTKARWDAMAATLVDLELLPEGSTADGAWLPR
jgi:NitT/TauT family transport system substrate-binding protein